MVLLSDLFVYWGHRLQHRVGFLWRFHAVHHSAEHLDWLAAHREHPLDTIYTIGIINLPHSSSAFPWKRSPASSPSAASGRSTFTPTSACPSARCACLFGAPELHHWHHARDRDAGNYANLSPLMDLLFGTYRYPDHAPENFGLPEPTARTYLGHMLSPFWTRKRPDQFKSEFFLTDHHPTDGKRLLETKATGSRQPVET